MKILCDFTLYKKENIDLVKNEEEIRSKICNS